MKNLFKITGIILIAFLSMNIMTSCNGADQKSTTNESTSEKVEEIQSQSSWVYSKDVDRMENTERHFAELKSTNKVNFEFPYEGGSYFTLIVRNMGDQNEVLLSVSKGAFMASVMSSNAVKVKFDDSTPELYTYNNPADGSSEIIFLDFADDFLTDLKASKTLLIEATFFDQGNKYIEFNTAGLEWDH